MNRRPSTALTVIALVAVMCAQVFGLSQGYACVCHGEVVVTESAHCHTGTSAGHNHGADSDCPGSSGHKEHQPLTQDLEAAALAKAPSAPAIMLAVISEGFMVEALTRPWATPAPSIEHTALATHGIPPAGLLVARCLVLLV